MGNSEVGHLNLGRGGPCSRICPGSTRRSPMARSSLARRWSPPAPGRGRPAPCTPSASSDLAACTPTTATCSPSSRWRPPRASHAVRVHALLDGRDTPPSLRARLRPRPGGPPGGGPPRRADRVGRRPLLRDGPRPALGADRARLRRDRPRRGPPGAVGDRRHRSGLRPGRDRRVRRAHGHRWHGRRAPGPRRRSSTSTSAPTAPASWPTRSRSRRSTGSTGRRPAGRPAPRDLLVVTLTEYEAGLPVQVAFGPEASRSLAQAFSERGLDASSTSPRPRSTPT